MADDYPKPLDPTDRGAVASATFTMTRSQVGQLAKFVDENAPTKYASVRLEKLRDAYVRVAFLGPDGDTVGKDRLLFPV
jgi:hypothetical protein